MLGIVFPSPAFDSASRSNSGYEPIEWKLAHSTPATMIFVVVRGSYILHANN